MPLTKEIEQQFYVPKSANTYMVEITINGVEEKYRRVILDQVYFELSNDMWKLEGLPIQFNLSTTSRTLFATKLG